MKKTGACQGEGIMQLDVMDIILLKHFYAVCIIITYLNWTPPYQFQPEQRSSFNGC